MDYSQHHRASWQDLWHVMVQESMRRWRHGPRPLAYDWQDIARVALHADLPDPATPERSRVLPLVYPDVWDFLVWSQHQRAQLYIVTNGFIRNQHPYLRALGWDKIMAAEIGSDSGYTKPDPRIFDLIPELDLHIGDRVAHDVLGAKRAAVVAVHVNRRDTKEDKMGWDPLSPAQCAADLTIMTLHELPQLVRNAMPDTMIRKVGSL